MFVTIMGLSSSENVSKPLQCRPGVYSKKPGVGVEPTYSCSAGSRLNRSATPAN